MSRSSSGAAPSAPFLHPVPVARLDREGEAANELRITPDAEALERIARFLGIPKLERLALGGRLAPIENNGWEFRGQLTAAAVQECVVTLAPVRETIDVPVRRTYLPGPAPGGPREVELAEADLDPPERFESTIDLGQLAVESLALALDPWPRAEGAALDPAHGGPEEAALDEDTRQPFAELAEFRARLLKNGSGKP